MWCKAHAKKINFQPSWSWADKMIIIFCIYPIKIGAICNDQLLFQSPLFSLLFFSLASFIFFWSQNLLKFRLCQGGLHCTSIYTCMYSMYMYGTWTYLIRLRLFSPVRAYIEMLAILTILVLYSTVLKWDICSVQRFPTYLTTCKYSTFIVVCLYLESLNAFFT